MKARIKIGSNAGRTIDAVDVDGYYFRNSKSGHLYCKEELDFSGDTVDWAAFRRDAAKDILCAILSGRHGVNPEHVTMAIEIADELVRKLQEEDKK